MGARPLGRVIQEHIKKPLADEVLFGKLKKGGTVARHRRDQGRRPIGLKLQSLADELPAQAPKKEQPKRDAAPRKPAVKRATARKPAAQARPRSRWAARAAPKQQPGAAAAAQGQG